jgi:hypothetical protein
MLHENEIAAHLPGAGASIPERRSDLEALSEPSIEAPREPRTPSKPNLFAVDRRCP